MQRKYRWTVNEEPTKEKGNGKLSDVSPRLIGMHDRTCSHDQINCN